MNHDREQREYNGFSYVLTATRLHPYEEPKKFRFSNIIWKKGEEVYRYPPKNPKDIAYLEDFTSLEEAMRQGRIHIYRWVDHQASN